MPEPWLESAGRAILRPAAQHVVPLLCAFDDSSFGRAARADFNLLRHPALQRVQRDCALSEIGAAHIEVTSAGYRSSIAPLELIPHQPIWACWFQDYSQRGLDQWSSHHRRFEQDQPGGVRWLLFLKLAADTKSHDVAKKVTDENASTFVFFLSEKGQLHRDQELLARGSVSFALAGWERFCTTGELDFEQALLLNGAHQTFALGMGSQGIDLAHHGPVWSRKVAEAIATRWRQPAGATVPATLPALEVLLPQLLPARGYRLDDPVAGAPPRPGVVVGAGEFHIGWEGGGTFQPLKGLSGKDNMRHYLSVVRDTRGFLAAIVLPNTVSFMRRRARALIERLSGGMSGDLALPLQPEGLFAFFNNRLASLRRPCAELAQAHVNGFSGGEAFQASLSAAHRRIDAVPNLQGAFLRLLLITIGLTWLFLGSFVWKTSDAGADFVLHRDLLIGALTLLGTLLVAIPASYAYHVARALRAMEAARGSMVEAHVWEVCRELVDRLRAIGSSLCTVLDQKEATVSELADAFAGNWPQSSIAVPENRRPLFPESSIAAVLQPKLGALMEGAYHRLRTRTDAPSLEVGAVRWREALLQESAYAAHEALAQTSFEEFVRHAKLAAQDRDKLVADAVHDARQSSLSLPPTEIPIPVLLIASDEWRSHVAGLENVHLHPIACPELVAISARPLSVG